MNSKEVSVPMSQVLDLVGSLLRFPFPTICRHAVAGDLLDLLERSGLNPGETFDELCGFVVGAHDDEALEALERLKDEERGVETLRQGNGPVHLQVVRRGDDLTRDDSQREGANFRHLA